MSLPFYIARRYLFSKKPRLIHWVSVISVLSIAIGSAALIVILSVFNGITSLIEGLNDRFDAELRIESTQYHSFDLRKLPLDRWNNDPRIRSFSPYLEELVLLRYNDNDRLVQLKGVSPNYPALNRLDTCLVAGFWNLGSPVFPCLILGQYVAFDLGLGFDHPNEPIRCYAPRKGYKLDFTSPNAFTATQAHFSGSFASQIEYDSQYALTNLEFMWAFLEADSVVTGVEMAASNPHKIALLERDIQQMLGPEFKVLNRNEQQEDTYRMIRSERLAIIIILSFILLIATLNMIAALMMMIYDKRKDLKTLQSIGMTTKALRRVFTYQGLCIALIGGGIGLLLGAALALGQEHFGWIRIGNETSSFIVNAYPVNVAATDFILVLGIVLVIGLCAAFIPAMKIKNISLKSSNTLS